MLRFLIEIGELDRERVLGRVGSHCAAFRDSMRESNVAQGSGTPHCKRQPRYTQRYLDLGDCIDNSAGIGGVTLDVDAGLERFPRSQRPCSLSTQKL